MHAAHVLTSTAFTDKTSKSQSCLPVPSNICVAAVLGHIDVLKAMLLALRPGTLVPSNDMYMSSGGAEEQQPGILKLGRIAKNVLKAKTSVGRTPLLLACENGCVLVLHRQSKIAKSYAIF